MIPSRTAPPKLTEPASSARPRFLGPILNNPSLLPAALDLPLQRQFTRRVASGRILLDPVLRAHLKQEPSE